MAPSTSTRAHDPGTRPEGAHNEREARRFIRDTFSFIAPRYDFLNHFLSLSLDRVWRRRTARHFRHVLVRPDACVLDICCGTGDLAIALKREADKEAGKQGSRKGAKVWGSDFARPMLRLARKKIVRSGRRSRHKTDAQREEACDAKGAALIELIEADALAMPFPDASVDLITTAFGFRNLVNYEAGLREIFRVLKPGGELGILEFASPHIPVMAPLYRFYFRHVLPRIGRALSGSNTAYSYLPSSVSNFPSPEELAALMRRCGYTEARFELWTAGVVGLYTGRKV